MGAFALRLPQDYIDRVVDGVTSAVPTERVYSFGSYVRDDATPKVALAPALRTVTRGA